MRQWRREVSQSELRQRSYGSCYLAIGMAGCLAAALLGAIYKQQAVWSAGLALFALLCVQGACGHCLSRERPVVAVIQITNTERPLSSSTF
jgi:hypothetical protein